MAGDWIKYVKGLSRKPEVMQIARILNLDRFSVTGRLMALFEWADDVTVDGNVPGASPADADDVVGCPGFFAALAATGARDQKPWVEQTASGIRFNNWNRHNGDSAKSRARNALNQKAKRHRGVTKMSPPSGDKTVTRAESREQSREQRAEQQRTEEDNAAVLSALPDESVKRNCSLLLKLVDTDAKGSRPFPIFDGRACAAIAADARCSEMRIVWAVEKLRSMRTAPRKKAAWLRAMILEDDKAPPAEWVSKYQRGQLAKLADPLRAVAGQPAGGDR